MGAARPPRTSSAARRIEGVPAPRTFSMPGEAGKRREPRGAAGPLDEREKRADRKIADAILMDIPGTGDGPREAVGSTSTVWTPTAPGA